MEFAGLAATLNLSKKHSMTYEKKIDNLGACTIIQNLQAPEHLQIKYQNQKGVSFGIAFGDCEITVKVMESVAELFIKATRSVTAFLADKYYKNHDSLFMSVRITHHPSIPLNSPVHSTKFSNLREGNRPVGYYAKVIEMVDSKLKLGHGQTKHTIARSNDELKNLTE